MEESKLDAHARWDKANTTQIRLKLNNHTDAELLDLLDSLSNKQGYIKALIKADIYGKHLYEEFMK